MAERTIRILLFNYDKDGVEQEGRKGDVVDLTDEEIEYGESIGAFEVEGADAPEAEKTLAEYDDPELIEWVEENQPTVQEVIDASGGDADLAKRLLSAEESATGGHPRKTLVEGLAEVINRGSQ